jgi:hypothetical protein
LSLPVENSYFPSELFIPFPKHNNKQHLSSSSSKMAELLGTVTAATQLVDQSLSIATKIHSFRNQVKKAPRRVNELLNHIRTLAEMVESIEDAEKEGGHGMTSKISGDVRKAMNELGKFCTSLGKS